MKPRARCLLFLLLATACSVLWAPPVQAATTSDAAPTPASTTTDTTPSGVVPPEALKVAVDLNRVELKLEPVDSQLRGSTIRLQTAQEALDQTNALIVANQQQLAVVRDRTASRAVIAYTRSGNRMSSVLSVQHIQDVNSGSHYAQVATDIDDQELVSLDKLERALEQERDARTQARDQVASDNQELSSLDSQLAARRQQDQALLDKWGAIPIMGDSWLTASQIASWYQSTGAVARLVPGLTIEQLAQIYLDEGASEHVRGDLAFAQSVIETASFSVAAGNNYSGIGVCDSCTGGYAFPTPRDGVRAQIQLLRNYADPDSSAAKLAHSPSPALYGADATKAAHLYDSFFLKGKAPIWNVMGNGNWATSTTYAHSVVDLFARMLTYAKAHPS